MHHNPEPVVIEADVRWLVELIAGDLVQGHDCDPEIYRAHVDDVIGALIGWGFSATEMRRNIENASGA